MHHLQIEAIYLNLLHLHRNPQISQHKLTVIKQTQALEPALLVVL